MAQLDGLILEKIATLCQLERFIKFVNGFDASNGVISQLEARVCNTYSLLEKFNGIQSKIDGIQQSVDDQMPADFQNRFFQVTSNAN